MKRYEAVGVIRTPRRTDTDEAIFYLDLFAPPGEQVRTCIEPIADEL